MRSNTFFLITSLFISCYTYSQTWVAVGGGTSHQVNKMGSQNVATKITLNPGDSFKITNDYRNITVVSKSAASAGSYQVKTK